jgi:hypothetical protein
MHDLSNLLSVATNEAQLIWNRFNVMVTANTVLSAVLAAFLAQDPNRQGWLAIAWGAVFGFLLCVLWFLLTWFGWEFSAKVVSTIADVAGNGLNPFRNYGELFDKRLTGSLKFRTVFGSDPIRVFAHLLIGLFMAAYIVIAVLGFVRACV